MDKKTRDLIADIIPGEPDPTLEPGEYYYLQETMGGPRVLRVFALEILPHRDGTEYGIYTRRGVQLVRVDSGWGDPSRGVHMHDLYDNKDDCRARTHYFYDEWERIREIQREEANHEAD